MTCGLDASAVRFGVIEMPRECWDTLRTMNPIERVNTEFKRRTKSMDHAGVDTHA